MLHLWSCLINWSAELIISLWQWEALALLLIGISVNQLRSLPEGTTALGLPVAAGAYIYTLIFVSELSSPRNDGCSFADMHCQLLGKHWNEYEGLFFGWCEFKTNFGFFSVSWVAVQLFLFLSSGYGGERIGVMNKAQDQLVLGES